MMITHRVKVVCQYANCRLGGQRTVGLKMVEDPESSGSLCPSEPLVLCLDQRSSIPFEPGVVYYLDLTEVPA